MKQLKGLDLSRKKNLGYYAVDNHIGEFCQAQINYCVVPWPDHSTHIKLCIPIKQVFLIKYQ